MPIDVAFTTGWSGASDGISEESEEYPMPARKPAPPETPTSAGEIILMLTALAPVTGAVLSGPGMGMTLVTLGVLDSILILTGLQ
jgi:hypothetical protein